MWYTTMQKGVPDISTHSLLHLGALRCLSIYICNICILPGTLRYLFKILSSSSYDSLMKKKRQTAFYYFIILKISYFISGSIFTLIQFLSAQSIECQGYHKESAEYHIKTQAFRGKKQMMMINMRTWLRCNYLSIEHPILIVESILSIQSLSANLSGLLLQHTQLCLVTEELTNQCLGIFCFPHKYISKNKPIFLHQQHKTEHLKAYLVRCTTSLQRIISFNMKWMPDLRGYDYFYENKKIEKSIHYDRSVCITFREI